MVCGCRHFEARQGPEAPECWRHLSVSVDQKSVEPVQKHVNKCEQRIIPELNDIILLKLDHEWYTTISVWAWRNLTIGRWFKMAQKLMLQRNYNPHQSGEHPCDVGAFQFLLPAFESGFWCSRNGGPPVIWIISLYLWYQVYFVIIIVEFLVTILSIAYLKNIFWVRTVPLSDYLDVIL